MADGRGEAARARRAVAFTLLAAVVGCSRESARRPAPSDVFVVSATSGGTSERVARIDRAIAFWTDRAHRDPFDWTAGTRAADAWIERARLTGDWRAYEAAEAALRRSLAVHPDDNAGALGRLARVLVARHRFADAAVAIEHALATAPPGRDGAWLHGVRGDVAFARGDFDAAARDYARFEAVTPGPAAWTRLANVAQTRGDLAGAEKFLRAALDATRERSPESAAWTGVQLAEVLRLSGRPEASERELAEAIRALPEYGPAWLHLADLHEAQGDRPRARRAVERARVHAVDPVARLQIARA
ncbi:MAG: tetratricopeptide repeat protein, partial [Myxococcales bacterium]|nr:tetratricopeptide repeat protein [Myxococcales bacterium]